MKLSSFAKLAAILIALAVLVAGVAIWRVGDLRWRAQAVWLVTSGAVPDLSVTDAVRMVVPGSGYWLETLDETRSAYATIKNPKMSAADVFAGAQTFREYCAGCHGANAAGGTGPALVNRNLTHGDSDWALLRTVRDGVKGTSMPPHDWSYPRIWQAISYVRSLAAPPTASGSATPPAAMTSDIDVPFDTLKAAKGPGIDWLSYGGSYSGTRHSSLEMIRRDNVSRLAPRWVHQFKRLGDRIQTSALVRAGVMYVTHGTSVLALDARSGTPIWEFNRPLPNDALSCCGVTNRGVAILGDKIFVGTIDAKIVALSARTGKKLWESAATSDYAQGVSITSAPLAFRDLVVTGAGGGDYPTRGFLVAFDAQTGKERWRFETVPGPNQPGHDTWPGETWRTGGGATWVTGSYDAERDVLIWGTGNPAPNHNAAVRRGDNLYTDSAVALRGTTGELLWHFQFTPNDSHDWDSSQTPILVDRPGSATPRQLIWANRNGFFYALNRDNGAFLHGAPFMKQTWAKGLDEKGRPIKLTSAEPTPTGTLVWPGVQGATNWWPPSYDPALDLMFVPALEHAGFYYSTDRTKGERGQLFLSGYTEAAPGVDHYQQVVAIRASDGTVAWRHVGKPSLSDDLHFGGLASTAGGLVFASDDQLFYALDSRDGKRLWSFPTGARIGGSPISFEVDGEQLVTIASGRMLMAFGLVPSK